MAKPLKAYNELFEDLMEYTDFKSSDEIKTKNDLYDFFKQVKSNSEKKNRKFKVSRNLFDRTMTALAVSGDTIVRKIERIKKSRKFYNSFQTAKAHDGIAVSDSREVYRSYNVTVNKKKIVRWRDAKGRFVKTPK